MTDYDQRLLILVAAPSQLAANQQAAKVDTDGGGELTFTAGLSPSGASPATHYWCSWQMTQAEKSSFTNYLDALVRADRCWIYDGLTTTPEQVLELHGLQRLRPPP